jgi:TolA-binding protein
MKKGIFLMFSLLLVAVQTGFGSDFTDKLGLGFSVGGQKLYGDAETGYFETGGSPLVLRFNARPSMYFETGFSYSGLSTRYFGHTLGTTQIDLSFKTGLRLMSQRTLNPLLYVGIGLFNYELLPNTRYSDAYGMAGAGLEYFLTDRFGANFSTDYRATTGSFDTGKGKDAFVTVALGINYYLGGRAAFINPKHRWVKATRDDGKAQINTVTSYDEPVPVPVTTNDPLVMQELTNLTIKKSELMTRLESREEDAVILRTKVESLDDYYELLKVRARITGADLQDQAALQDGSDIAFRNGLALYEARQYQDAADTFVRLLHDNPNDPRTEDWWYWLGESYFGAEDFDSASKCFRWSLLQNQDNARKEMVQLMLGLSLWKAGDADDAHKAFSRLAKASPGTPYESIANRYMTEIELGK